jgi:Cu+-exporting ATPase
VIYNIIGLTFAVMGILTPVYTAILMPISSLTVIGFTLGMSSYAGRKIALKENQ